MHAALRDGAEALGLTNEAGGDTAAAQRRSVVRKTPTYGSRPVGGWESDHTSWTEAEARKSLERAQWRYSEQVMRREAIRSIRERPTMWADAGVDYSRPLPLPSRSKPLSLSRARSAASIQRYEKAVAPPRIMPISEAAVDQWRYDAVMWRETGFRAQQRIPPRYVDLAKLAGMRKPK